MAKVKEVTLAVSLDDVLSEIDLEVALEWYSKDLGSSTFIEEVEEFVEGLK